MVVLIALVIALCHRFVYKKLEYESLERHTVIIMRMGVCWAHNSSLTMPQPGSGLPCVDL